MTHVGDEHVDVQHDEEGMPTKGRALVRQTDFGNGVIGPLLWFRCPRDRYYCGVPITPSPPNSRGCAWTQTGPDDAPTLSPSINCNGGGCGWHGFIENGALRDA